MADSDDEDREAILGRRAKLVALALASLTSVVGCDSCADSQPCLSVEPTPDPPPGKVLPNVCLSPVNVDPDPEPEEDPETEAEPEQG